MNSRTRFAACMALAALSCDVLAVGGLANVTIIDRDTGAVMAPHYFRGEYWVAGTPGARYAIEIHNRSGGRLLTVTSVDGVNVISGETAGWGQTGYVFDPGERYQITGWRKSDAEVAAFTFTSLPDSYAARTGRPANVGVIGVAVFRERRPPPAISELTRPQGLDEARAQAPAAGAPGSPTPLAPLSALEGLASRKAEKLGTGHGEREYSHVNYTQFERLQPEPNEVVRIRYDSLENLIAMGVVRAPRPTPEGADPFPSSRDRHYVPDPP